MNIVLQTSERTLVSISSEELASIANALNEVCNGIAIPDSEFQTRLGLDRKSLQDVLKGLHGAVNKTQRRYDAVDVWSDQGSVIVRAITAFGDPVEMGEAESAEFLATLQKAISEAQ